MCTTKVCGKDDGYVDVPITPLTLIIASEGGKANDGATRNGNSDLNWNSDRDGDAGNPCDGIHAEDNDAIAINEKHATMRQQTRLEVWSWKIKR